MNNGNDSPTLVIKSDGGIPEWRAALLDWRGLATTSDPFWSGLGLVQ